jgi:DNA-binding NarL/FixJ family response regulator
MTMAARVVIADDSTLFREGLAALLSRDRRIMVVGQARTGVEAVQQTVALCPDVALLDLMMPEGGGLAATRQIRAERPDQVIGILTVSAQEADLFAAIRAGARGYLLKTIPVDQLIDAIITLAGGGAVISPQLAPRFLREFARLTAAAAEHPLLAKLSIREQEVLAAVAAGASNREIGDRLGITENTVKVHLHNLTEKLGVRNRQQAAALVARAQRQPAGAGSGASTPGTNVPAEGG